MISDRNDLNSINSTNKFNEILVSQSLDTIKGQTQHYQLFLNKR